MKRARTIREAAAWFKACDPDTALTETAIRTLVRNGRVPSARVGKKYLITIEALEGFITGQTEQATPKPKADRNWIIK